MTTRSEGSVEQPILDESVFRRAMGVFPSGIAIVTTFHSGRPVGLAVQSFVSLSLNPPLIAFAPAATSRTWDVIQQTGHFGISILGQHQEHISRRFGSKMDNKFKDLPLELSPGGNPIIADSLIAIDATIDNVFDGGDHHIVVGRVQWIGAEKENKPLLFYKGQYFTTAVEEGASSDSCTVVASSNYCECHET